MMQKPKKRSSYRIWCGTQYYRLRRYLLWFGGKYQFAKKRQDVSLPYEYIHHQTPLLRRLKGADMYLQHNKVKNLELAVARINGIVIQPGETFSYWKLIGKPTKRKGYLPGMELFCGQIREGIGGGLCQLSNLIYWMALHSPLTVTERYRHSYDVFPDSNRVIPFGCGATCVYNYRDLMLKNETGFPFQINVWLEDGHLHGRICGEARPSFTYQIYEREHYMQMELFGKYSRNNVIARRVFDLEGNQVDDEYITENHALMMYDPMIEGE